MKQVKFSKISVILILLVITGACSSSDDSPAPTTPTTEAEQDPTTFDVQTIPLTFSIGNAGLDDLTLDSEGNIYVSNFGQNTNGVFSGKEVFKITPEGEKTTFSSTLNVPGGIVIDSNGDIFVHNQNDITKITPEGVQSTFVTSSTPFGGLTIDENNVIYSALYSGSTIRAIATDGTIDIIARDSRLRGSAGIAYHQPSTTLYVGNFDDGKIYSVSLDGVVTEIADAGESIGRMIEMNGALYATLFEENKIAKITLDGTVEIIAGSGSASQADGSLLEASFNKPNGIAGDAANNILYVSDYAAPRVSKIQL